MISGSRIACTHVLLFWVTTTPSTQLADASPKDETLQQMIDPTTDISNPVAVVSPSQLSPIDRKAVLRSIALETDTLPQPSLKSTSQEATTDSEARLLMLPPRGKGGELSQFLPFLVIDRMLEI